MNLILVKMKLTSITLAFLLISITVFSQSNFSEPSISVSRDYHIEDEGVPIVISNTGNGLVAYQDMGDDRLNIGYLDSEFQFTDPIHVNLNDDNDELAQSLLEVYFRNGKVFVITVGVADADDKANEIKSEVKYFSIDLASKKISEPVEIMENDLLKSSSVKVVESLNHKFTLVWYSNKSGSKNMQVNIVVLDEEFDEVNTIE